MGRATATGRESPTEAGLEGVITATFDLDLPELGYTRSRTNEAIIEDLSTYRGSRTRLFVWFREGERGIETVLSNDPSVGGFRRLLSGQGRSLYRLAGTSPDTLEEFLGVVMDTDSLVLDARIDESCWTFRTRIPDRGSLAEFRTWSDARGFGFTLRKVYRGADTWVSPYGLSDPQWEILLTALERGYFEIPREVTLSTLATEVGISDQAASERIRRGVKTILENVVDTPSRG